MAWLDAADTPPANALALVGELKVMVPLAGLIDLGTERVRLQREVARREQELDRLTGKLGNPDFVNRAPAAVVEKGRQKQHDAEAALATLRQQLASIASS